MTQFESEVSSKGKVNAGPFPFSHLDSKRYLCDPSDKLDLVLLKRYPSLYTSLHSLISSANPAGHCLPTCNVLRN